MDMRNLSSYQLNLIAHCPEFVNKLAKKEGTLVKIKGQFWEYNAYDFFDYHDRIFLLLKVHLNLSSFAFDDLTKKLFGRVFGASATCNPYVTVLIDGCERVIIISEEHVEFIE
jgi:hypothetical protein